MSITRTGGFVPFILLSTLVSGTAFAQDQPNILVIWGDDIGQANIRAALKTTADVAFRPVRRGLHAFSNNPFSGGQPVKQIKFWREIVRHSRFSVQEKGEPVARRGRKVTGLASRELQAAGPPWIAVRSVH